MVLRLSALKAVVCILATFEFIGKCAATLPVAPIARAEAALNGLFLYSVQQESGSAVLPPATGCPCYTCSGKNCTQPNCIFCTAKSENPCPTKVTPGCYTTEATDCTCNRPPGPVPPNATSPATFFFTCGQMGGLGPIERSGFSTSYSTCRCEIRWPSGCTNCYRWWSAVALEAAVNFVIETGMALNESLAIRILDIAESMWIHSPYNARWDPIQKPTYVDDFAWYAIAYLRVYDLTGDDKWRQRAAAIHAWCYEYGYDKRQRNNSKEECGGFWWNLGLQFRFKDSISIVEVLHAAARLATPVTPSANRSHYLDSAISIWNWLFEFDNGTGLLAPNGIVSTGALPESCCSANSAANVSLGWQCVNSGVPGMSYNQGVLMSSAALLYNITGKEEYLSRGIALFNAAYENLTNSEGAVRDVQRGSRSFVDSNSYCGAYSGDPGSDFFSFKGIFVTHLTYFAQTLNKSGVLTKDVESKILSIIANSSNNAWNKSIVNSPFPNDDVCSPVATTISLLHGAKYPKFHWWWTTSNTSVETPPNPYLWFEKKSGLSCDYNETSVIFWQGNVPNADSCKQRCANESYANCTKFMFYGSPSTQLDASACSCFTCSGKKCPNCQFCDTLAEKACPKKTSRGCYTTAKTGCTCDGYQPLANCWLYRQIPLTGFDREKGHSCAKTTSGYVVAAKRPKSLPGSPMTTCKGRCGSNVARFKENSSLLCYCDAACSRHLDCCVDYVNQCLPTDKQNPTCFNQCRPTSGNVSHPLRGGGYCYCDTQCSHWFTDNNSFGGCCGDYVWHCGGGKQDQLCLDVRTQTQAVSVFVAHHALTKDSALN